MDFKVLELKVPLEDYSTSFLKNCSKRNIFINIWRFSEYIFYKFKNIKRKMNTSYSRIPVICTLQRIRFGSSNNFKHKHWTFLNILGYSRNKTQQFSNNWWRKLEMYLHPIQDKYYSFFKRRSSRLVTGGGGGSHSSIKMTEVLAREISKTTLKGTRTSFRGDGPN